MGMESFGKKIRAAVLGASVVGGAVTTEGALDMHKAEAQTIHQESGGNNSPNIIGDNNVVNGGGRNEIRTPDGNIVRMPGLGRPNIATSPDGSIRQESHGDNSPNIIDKRFRQ